MLDTGIRLTKEDRLNVPYMTENCWLGRKASNCKKEERKIS